MNARLNTEGDMQGNLCTDVIEYVRGFGAYAVPAIGPTEAELPAVASVNGADRAVCIRVLCAPALRAVVMARIAKVYTVLGRGTGLDGTSYWACAVPLTIRAPSVPEAQTFTIAIP